MAESSESSEESESDYISFEDVPYSDDCIEQLHLITVFLEGTYRRFKGSPSFFVEAESPIGKKYLEDDDGTADPFKAPGSKSYYVMNPLRLTLYKDEILEAFRQGDDEVYTLAVAKRTAELGRLREMLKIKRETTEAVKCKGVDLPGYTERCIICYTNPPCVITIPCQHCITCTDCCKRLESLKCPMCNAVVEHISVIEKPVA